MSARITKTQIAKIWTSAHVLGLDKELLYLLVPRGSISAMTRAEASELIEHLISLHSTRPERTPWPQGGRPLLNGPDAPTQHQWSFIYFLFGRIGWLQQPARMRGFLRKFAGVQTVEDISSRKKASALIEALKAIHKRQKTREEQPANQS